MNNFKKQISLIALTGYIILLFAVSLHFHPHSFNNNSSILSSKRSVYTDPFSLGTSGCRLEFFIQNNFSAIIKYQDIILNNSIVTLNESSKQTFVQSKRLYSFSLRAPPYSPENVKIFSF
jgi:hypothetical protein